MAKKEVIKKPKVMKRSDIRVVPWEEFIEALEDPTRYKRAVGTLYKKTDKDDVKHMCCLGVYADLAGVTWDKVYEDYSYEYHGRNTGGLDPALFKGHPILKIEEPLVYINDSRNTRGYKSQVRRIKQFVESGQ